MSETKVIYGKPLHGKSRSHDVLIMQHENGIKLTMTYEAYHANERLTGEQFINGKWEHTFDMMDLGVMPDTSIYVSNEGKRIERAEKLFILGGKLFNILNQ